MPIGINRSARRGVVSAIPDAGLLHNFDPRELSLNNDDTGNRINQESSGDDLSGTNSPTFKTSLINGNPGWRYDNDYHSGTFASAISPPFEIFHVFQARSVNTSERYLSASSNTVEWLIAGSDYQIFDGNNTLTGDIADTNAHIGVSRFATDGEIQLEDNSPTTGTDLSNSNLDGLTAGADQDGTNTATINSGQILVYDPSANGYSRADVVTYLIDVWGPF